MNIVIALEVIGYLDTEFDTHDFIRKLLEKHPEVYGRYLVDHGNVATADGEISKYLADHSTELSITRTGDAPSENILDHVTVCATWSK